ncbi:MAG: membrane protein insertase YidC, partial [Bacteroidales bacterium]|nr:membrane protein insertase YidC [Bacteroidales bacterium]
MDRNTIIGLLLIFGLIAGYSWWASPSAEEREQLQRERQEQQIADAFRQDSIAQLAAETSETTDGGAHTQDTATVLRDVNNVFSGSQIGETQITTLETDVFVVDFTNLGGAINRVNLKNYLTWTKDSLFLFNQQWQDFYISFFVNNRLINSKDYYFETVVNAPNGTKITGDQTAQIAMRLYAESGDEGRDMSRYIEFVYNFKGNDYMIDFQMNFVGMNDLISNRTNFIDLHWQADLPRNEKAKNLEDPNTAIYYKP